ncbi:MAG: ribbon-helix-helix domain-containing protein [Acidimicrobiales bacterium]
MKRLQIMIDEDLEEALDRRSAEEGVSKAALIRRFVRHALKPLPALGDDPLSAMVGADDFEPAPVDDVVYR